MALFPSRAPDISEGLPAGFTKRTTFGGGNTPPPSNGAAANFLAQADILIADQPFRLAISEKLPYRRQSAQLSKNQLDTSKEPGEQTLTGWWTRSQSSWHRGAGIKFYEPGSDNGTEYRYADSQGVDVWTEGQITLLKAMEPHAIFASSPYVDTVTLNNTPGVIVSGNSGHFILYGDGGNEAASSSTPSSRAVVRGGQAWRGISTGIIRMDMLSGDPGGTSIATQSAGPLPQVWYAKSRLIVARQNKLYELAPYPTSVVNLDTATPFFVHPLSEFRFTSVAEGPKGIYASGYTTGQGAIYFIGLDTTTNTALPVLARPTEVATFPPGEECHALYIYIGAYVAIGTNRGVRIGLLAEDGGLNYGPVNVPTDRPVTDFAGRDSFIYAGITAGINGKSGAARINLAEPLPDNDFRFPWAWDVVTTSSNTVLGICLIGNTDRVAIGIQDAGVFFQSEDKYVERGSLTTGAIRFGTNENKQFQLAKLAGTTASGGITLATVSGTGVESSIANFGGSRSPDGDVRITSPLGPQELLSTKLILSAGVPATETPLVRSFTIKALPAPGKRQRLIQLPLYCYDSETDRYGNTVHGIGYERLVALEHLEATSALVQVVDRRTGESFTAMIEEIDYSGVNPPDRSHSYFDGLVSITLRTI